MSYSPSVYKSAAVLIRRYGPDAATHAMMRANDLFDEGHVMGSVVWRSIFGAVREFLDQEMAKDSQASYRF